MLACFLRHAEAGSHAGSDFDRRLTEPGIEQAGRVAKFCARGGIIPDVILSSPVTRARETAEILSDAFGVGVLEEDWLACGMQPETCLAELSARAGNRIVFLVGHEPDLSHIIADLIGIHDPSALKIRKAALTGVEIAEFHVGCGQLQFFVPARLM